MNYNTDVSKFLEGKTEFTKELFDHFVDTYAKIAGIELTTTKTMIAIAHKKKIAFITQLGKNFIHVVFPFNKALTDNYCFTKIAQVPGTDQFNHHLRIYFKDDINDEVKNYMKLAIELE